MAAGSQSAHFVTDIRHRMCCLAIAAEAYDDALSYLAIAGPYDDWVAVVEGDCSTIGDAVPLVGRPICRSRDLASFGAMQDAVCALALAISRLLTAGASGGGNMLAARGTMIGRLDFGTACRRIGDSRTRVPLHATSCLSGARRTSISILHAQLLTSPSRASAARFWTGDGNTPACDFDAALFRAALASAAGGSRSHKGLGTVYAAVEVDYTGDHSPD
jgi:hypothetical protein